MERRGFLKAVIGGVAVAVAVQTFPFKVFSFPTKIVIPTIGEYAEYCNFSSFAISTAMDEHWSNVAEQLAYVTGQRIDDLVEGKMILYGDNYDDSFEKAA